MWSWKKNEGRLEEGGMQGERTRGELCTVTADD
jgi:hypothetical protein